MPAAGLATPAQSPFAARDNRAMNPLLGKLHPYPFERLRALTDRITPNPALRPMLADVRAQLDGLVRPGFIADAGVARLPDLGRYLKGIAQRLDKGPANLAKDTASLEQVDAVEGRYADLLDGLRPAQRAAAEVVAIGWMIEELRVSLFAQTLGTAYSVSAQRVVKAIARLTP